jgi:hypothetical protein
MLAQFGLQSCWGRGELAADDDEPYSAHGDAKLAQQHTPAVMTRVAGL